MSSTRDTTEQSTPTSPGRATPKTKAEIKKQKQAKARAKAKALAIKIKIANTQARAKKTEEMKARIAASIAKKAAEKAEEAKTAEAEARKNAKQRIVKNVMEKLFFPFLLANDEAWVVQRNLLICLPDALYDTLPKIFEKLHDEALLHILWIKENDGYHQSRAETREFLHYSLSNMETVDSATRSLLIQQMPIRYRDMMEANQSLEAVMRIKTQYLEDFLRDIKAWVICPKYLDTLVNLPKPRARIQDSYPGYYDLTIYKEIALQMQDKIAQLQQFLFLMGIKNMTPPPPWYVTAITASYNRLHNLTSYIGSSALGFFASPKTVQSAPEPVVYVNAPAGPTL